MKGESSMTPRSHSPARVALGIAKRIELFQVDVTDASLFFQLAARGGFQRFLRLDKTSRDCPAIRWVLTFDQDDPFRFDLYHNINGRNRIPKNLYLLFAAGALNGFL